MHSVCGNDHHFSICILNAVPLVYRSGEKASKRFRSLKAGFSDRTKAPSPSVLHYQLIAPPDTARLPRPARRFLPKSASTDRQRSFLRSSVCFVHRQYRKKQIPSVRTSSVRFETGHVIPISGDPIHDFQNLHNLREHWLLEVLIKTVPTVRGFKGCQLPECSC